MKTDVLVIGGGLSGRLCAQTASEECEVTLVSDGNGASPYIHGINIPLDKRDSVEIFTEDTLKSGRYICDKKLVDILCKGSLDITEEYCFDKKDGEYALLQPVGSSYPRVAGIGGRTGACIMTDINRSKSFFELKQTRATELIVKDNTVIGARLYDKNKNKFFSVYAKAVVLATGGFGGIFPFSTNSSDIGGDGIAMAYNAGAALCDMEFIQFEPSAAVYPPSLRGKSIITTMFYEGAVLRNKYGDRFTDEKVNKDELAVAIFNEVAKGNGTENGGVYFDMTAVPKNLLTNQYKDYYNRYINAGIDISQTPVEVSAAPHTTLGGVRINEKCETSVHGLFACGEVAGGIHGANRLGGNAGLEVLVFGKLAGKSAAAYAKTAKHNFFEQSDEPLAYTADTNEIEDMRRELESASKELGVIRNGKGLMKAISVADTIISKTKSRNSFMSRCLYNDALCLYISLNCALYRKSSIGCHIREDSIAENKSYRVIARSVNGKLSMGKENVI